MTTKWAHDRIMPLARRNPLFDEPWNPTHECWTMCRDDGNGQIHIGYVPWMHRTICHVRLVADASRFIWEWRHVPKWGETWWIRDNWERTCKHCLREASRPWEVLLPAGFDPPVTPDDAMVIADWWAEHGQTAKENCVRRWAMS